MMHISEELLLDYLYEEGEPAERLKVARHLQVPLNSPVAEVRRIFRDADRTVIYLGEVTYRGDFVRIDMDLRP